ADEADQSFQQPATSKRMVRRRGYILLHRANLMRQAVAAERRDHGTNGPHGKESGSSTSSSSVSVWSVCSVVDSSAGAVARSNPAAATDGLERRFDASRSLCCNELKGSALALLHGSHRRYRKCLDPGELPLMTSRGFGSSHRNCGYRPCWRRFCSPAGTT